MGDEIIKVLEYILNSDIIKMIGSAYLVYAAILIAIVILVFVSTLKNMKNHRRW